MKKLLFCSLALILLTSCQKKEKENPVGFEKFDYQNTIVLAHDDTTKNSSCFIDIQLLYPNQYENSQVLDKIKQSIVSQTFDSSYTNLNGIESIDKFTGLTKVESSSNSNQKFKDTIGINTVIYNEKANILVYEIDKTTLKKSFKISKSNKDITEKELNYLYYLVFDKKTGNRVTLKDILNPGSEEQLASVIKQKMMDDYDFASEEEMINGGFFYLDNILKFSNFAPNEGGNISFFYNPYDIANEAVGLAWVDFSYNELKPFLKPDSPISIFFPKEKKQ